MESVKISFYGFVRIFVFMVLWAFMFYMDLYVRPKKTDFRFSIEKYIS